MNRLRLCEGCSRHVRESEQVCPFCQQVLAPLQLPAAVRLPAGLSRAQRLALAAAAAVVGQTIAACTADGDGGSMVQPVYGGSVPPATAGARATVAGRDAGPGSGGAGVVAVPVYGAPLAGTQSLPIQKPDAGRDAGDEDAGVAPDASTPDGGPTVHPVYGAPVPVYGAPIPQK
jgi:hypothetical protein